MDIASIRPTQDNVLVVFEAHEKARQEEEMVNGIYIPRTAHEARKGEAILATVIAVGPGHYADPFVNYEVGSDPYKSGRFIPMDPEIRVGRRVLLEGAALGGDRIFDNGRLEYRMIKAHCIAGVIEE